MERNNYNRGGGGGGGRGGGRGAGRGDGRGGGNYHHHQQQQQQGQNQSGGGRGFRPPQGYGGRQRPPVGQGGNNGAWGQNRPIQTANNLPPAQAWGPRPVRGEGGANRSPASPAGAANLRPAQPWGPRPVQVEVGVNRSPANPAGANNLQPSQTWGPRPWPVQGQDGGNRFPANSTGGGSWSEIVTRTGVAPPPPPPPQTRPPAQTDLPLPVVQTLRISEQQGTSLQGGEEGRIVPMKRPDSGGRSAGRKVQLQANCFPIKYNSKLTLFRYDVQIEAEKPAEGRFKKRTLKKSDLCLLWEKLFSDAEQFQRGKAVFDGHSIFSSTNKVPTGEFEVKLLEGEDTKAGSYLITIKFVNEYKYSAVNDYLNGVLENNPRDILQGLELVMKENPSKNGMCFGRSTFPFTFRREDDLRCGVAAFRGFQQSLKPTSNALSLVLDTSVLPLRKSMPVIDFLMENVQEFRGVNDVNKLQRDVERALKGLKVTVTHRSTNQRFTVMGLTKETTRVLSFTCVDREGKVPLKHVKVSDYFVEKYKKKIVNMDIPCLELGTRKDAVPMEFCVIAGGQRYPKEKLDDRAAKLLRNISMVPPAERKHTICQIVQSNNGPCGGQVAQNFGLEVDPNMTTVTARVLDPPTVKLGNRTTARLDQDKCQWNLVQKSLVKGVSIHRWALLDFSDRDLHNILKQEKFISKLDRGRFIRMLMERCKSLGIHMDAPLAVRTTTMDQLRSVENVRRWLEKVIQLASQKKDGRLQLIVCAMAFKDPGYNLLKLVSETELGVLTQCLLSENANKDRNDQFLANLALKINAKVGGSNFEVEKLPGLENEQHVMLIGADVNHPAPMNATSPSIAAVVATVNWPAANKYAARVRPQEHRKEQIVEFGSMCLDLLNTYARLNNNVKPKKIVIFRDGVSDGQFDMVLNEELCSLKTAIYDEHYKPEITLIVAQKRHHTRLFLEDDKQGVRQLNVPPGTVVDSRITHPSQFDFYLCSHFGGLGTSKSTHYQALFDKHHFSSDQLQKLIYDLCFTFVRCTKPVSLVPPVYYADLVAYRGRLYYNATMELQSCGSISSSSSATSFNKNFFKVHPNLQDSMFFV